MANEAKTTRGPKRTPLTIPERLSIRLIINKVIAAMVNQDDTIPEDERLAKSMTGREFAELVYNHKSLPAETKAALGAFPVPTKMNAENKEVPSGISFAQETIKEILKATLDRDAEDGTIRVVYSGETGPKPTLTVKGFDPPKSTTQTRSRVTVASGSDGPHDFLQVHQWTHDRRNKSVETFKENIKLFARDFWLANFAAQVQDSNLSPLTTEDIVSEVAETFREEAEHAQAWVDAPKNWQTIEADWIRKPLARGAPVGETKEERLAKHKAAYDAAVAKGSSRFTPEGNAKPKDHGDSIDAAHEAAPSGQVQVQGHGAPSKKDQKGKSKHA